MTFVNVIRRDHLSTDKDTKIVDFASLCTYLTIDSITKLGFGKELGYIENNADPYEYIEAVQKTLPLISVVSVIPMAVTVLSIPFVKAIVAPSPKDKKGIGKLLTYVFYALSSALKTNSTSKVSQIDRQMKHLRPTVEQERT